MNYKIKNLPGSKVEIQITVPEDTMEKSRKIALEKLGKDVKIKGFRPGKVPTEILKEHIGPGYIEAQAQDIAIQKAYSEVVQKEKLQVIDRAQIKLDEAGEKAAEKTSDKEQEPKNPESTKTSKDSEFTFIATVSVMPKVEIPGYEKIKVKKEEVKVSKKDVEEVLEDLQKRNTTYKDVERAAKEGDRVEVEFEGFDEKGKELPNTKSKNHPIIIGQKMMIPGFEEELVGMKREEEKEFKITFPKDYHEKSFQGKKTKFKVKVNRIEEAEVPKLDGDLIEKAVGKKISLDQVRKDIEANIQATKEQEALKKQENEYIEELLKKTKVELPEVLVEEETAFILHDAKQNIAGKGGNFEEVLAQSGTTEQDLKGKYREEAERRIKVRMALRFLMEAEKISVDEKELSGELERMKAYYPATEHQKLDQDFQKGQLKVQIYNRIAIDKLFQKVLGNNVDKKTEKSDKDEKSKEKTSSKKTKEESKAKNSKK